MNNKYIYIGIALPLLALFTTFTAQAQTEEVAGVATENVSMTRNANLMTVSMDMDFRELTLKHNHSAIFVPTIVRGEHSKELPSVGIYGRTRWYQHLRSEKSLQGEEMSYLYSKRPASLEYTQNIPYEEWMNGSHLEVRRYDYSCCNNVLSEGGAGESLSSFSYYDPEFRYLRPAAELSKSREFAAKAYVDYPVDRTDIQPNFSNNRSELNKITAVIDALRKDGDITVSSLAFKGYASPEGPYAHNAELAQGRVEALKNYVSSLYHFNDDFIATDYVAEDWDGLRDYIEDSHLDHKKDILKILDDKTLDPDAKEWRIKSLYGEEYKHILETYYPALRRSEYSIAYTVRSYDDVDKIREVMATAPQNLSLEEMYVLAQSLEPGSDEYNEVFETAVRLYPNDETANLNAANVAMSCRDLRRAERYLSRAGSSAEAVYARGVLAGLKGDIEGAEKLIGQAGAMGLEGTDAALERLHNTTAY